MKFLLLSQKVKCLQIAQFEDFTCLVRLGYCKFAKYLFVFVHIQLQPLLFGSAYLPHTLPHCGNSSFIDVNY